MYPHSELFWENEEISFKTLGGLANMKTLFDQERTANPNIIVLDGGDLIQGSAVGKAAANLSVSDSTTYGTFKVVVCGKSVQDLLDEEKMADAVAILQKSGVEMYACGLSLKKFGVDPASLPEFYQVVPNGLFFGFELQKEGYYSIAL